MSNYDPGELLVLWDPIMEDAELTYDELYEMAEWLNNLAFRFSNQRPSDTSFGLGCADHSHRPRSEHHLQCAPAPTELYRERAQVLAEEWLSRP